MTLHPSASWLASMLSVPNAKVSLRITQTIQTNWLQVLRAFKNDDLEGILCEKTQ